MRPPGPPPQSLRPPLIQPGPMRPPGPLGPPPPSGALQPPAGPPPAGPPPALPPSTSSGLLSNPSAVKPPAIPNFQLVSTLEYCINTTVPPLHTTKVICQF